jgi:hypothetical protein
MTINEALAVYVYLKQRVGVTQAEQRALTMASLVIREYAEPAIRNLIPPTR